MVFNLTKLNRRGQVIIEYALILGLVLIVLFGMSPMIKRTTQSMIKVVADQVGNQQEGDQMFDSRTGHLKESYATTRASIDKTVDEGFGFVKYSFDDDVLTKSNQLVNLGFQEN